MDSSVCAGCHKSVAEAYRATGMGQSFFRPAPGNAKEDYTTANDIYHAPSDSHYAMIHRGDEYLQRRWQVGFDGKETNVEEMRIDYVMGSGNHARSYLHRTERGMLIELPLGWYPSPGKAAPGWAMVPGSDTAHPLTRRYVAYKCMNCHNAYPSIPEGHDAPGSEPVFSGALPEGIDCQRCHGPGGAHAEAVKKQGATREAIRASIVNPARLNPKLQMDSCMQCHLETSSGHIPAIVQKFDRGPFSFTPGEPLENFELLFDHAPGTGHEDKFEAVSSAYRLRQSRCFLESGDRLTCLTCHDPHRVPRGGEAVRHYASVCRECHATKLDTMVSAGSHPAGPDCVSCHMPKRRAEDAPRVVMTDHLIQRRPASNPLAEFPERPAAQYLGEVVPYYPAPLPANDRNALYRAVAQVGLGNNVAAGMPELVRAIERAKPSEAEFYTVLGDGWRTLGKTDSAVSAYGQAVRASSGGVAELLALAAVLPPGKAEEILKGAVRDAPRDPEPLYQYGLLDASLGRLSEAAAKIRAAIALDPAMPVKSRDLADVLLRAGRPIAALEAARSALRTDPFDAAAWDVQAKVLTEQSAFAEAFFDFERAIRLHPYASYLYDYGLALVRADRFDEAQIQALAAVRADSSLVEAHELLGGLYLRKQQLIAAAAEYRAAVALRPELGRTRLRLGSVLAQQGDKAGAAEQWQQAAHGSDQSVAEQALRLLRQVLRPAGVP